MHGRVEKWRKCIPCLANTLYYLQRRNTLPIQKAFLARDLDQMLQKMQFLEEGPFQESCPLLDLFQAWK